MVRLRPQRRKSHWLIAKPTEAFSVLTCREASRQVNTLNASVGFAINQWDFLLWGRNLTNDDYLLQAFPAVAQTGSFSGYPNEPRRYGLTVKYNF